jgi:hypothetical protein
MGSLAWEESRARLRKESGSGRETLSLSPPGVSRMISAISSIDTYLHRSIGCAETAIYKILHSFFRAFCSLETFPDKEAKFQCDQNDHHPFQEVGVLNAHFVREHGIVLPDHLDLATHALGPLAAAQHL